MEAERTMTEQTALVVANRYGEVTRSYQFAQNGQALSRRELAAYVQTVRYTLAQMFGEQTAFGGARNYDKVLGYKTNPTVEDYYLKYRRQDIAARLVDVPAQDSFKRPPRISEDGDTETPFCQAWVDLFKSKRVWNRLMRADKLSGIGQFGVLLLGLRDGGELNEPVKRKLSGPGDVLFLRPLSQRSAKVKTIEDNSQSERFGLPLVYELQLSDVQGDWTEVHWSRILHVAEGKMDNEIDGTPRLERTFDRLDDLLKLVGGTAEANWWAMRPGTVLGLKEGYRQTMTDAEIEEEIEDMTHDPMRIAFMNGIEASQIGAPTILDISSPVDVTIALLSAASGIPQRKLMGSAQGEAASAEWDNKQWAGEVSYRQSGYVEPEIARPFGDRMIEYGVLPEPASGEYHLGQQDRNGEWRWPSILEQTDLEMAEIAQRYSMATKNLSDPLAVYPIGETEKRVMLNLPEERPEEESPEQAPDDVEALHAHASHLAVLIDRTCPLCGFPQAERYDGHEGLLRCASCKRTYDPELE